MRHTLLDRHRLDDLKTLARMSVRLHGGNPDEHFTYTLGGLVVFEGVRWRYPDFLDRAEAAYEALHKPVI